MNGLAAGVFFSELKVPFFCLFAYKDFIQIDFSLFGQQKHTGNGSFAYSIQATFRARLKHVSNWISTSVSQFGCTGCP